MSAVNNFLPFCPNNTGTNLESQADYAADSNRTNGNQPGVASSNLNNKALRQATYIAGELAEYLKVTTNQSILDNNTPAQLLAQMVAALKFFPPHITTITATGAGTYNLPYIFTIATGSATATATYSDGTTTFTVLTTVASGLELKASGAAAPVTGGNAGTLTKTGGTGDATITYYAVRAPVALNVQMVGAGGGGGASITNAGATGGNTTFGTTLLVANGGVGGSIGNGAGGAGGSASLGSGPTGVALSGASGGSGFVDAATTGAPTGTGGGTPFGGGTSATYSVAGVNAVANTGAGGSGSGGDATHVSGAGGGAGGYVNAWISSPLSTYAYSNGAKGAGGAAGTIAGGNGADGIIFIIAHYQ